MLSLRRTTVLSTIGCFRPNLYVCVQEKTAGGVYLQFIHAYIDILAKMAYYLCIALNAKSGSVREWILQCTGEKSELQERK